MSIPDYQSVMSPLLKLLGIARSITFTRLKLPWQGISS